VTEAQPLVLATPQAPAGTLSGRVIAKALRDNALLAFPPEAFEEDVVYRRFFGRQQIILNRPAGIHHILVDNPDNYRRTPATMRMLRPLLGNGLLLSEGEDWKHQRRTAAPAFAPRTMPLLARHVAHAAEAAVASLAASAERSVELLATMQSLALEIAGTSMFSLAMEHYRPELRDLITRYTAGLGRPSLLDFLLPLAIPSPRDLARGRVRTGKAPLGGSDRPHHRRATRKGVGGSATRPVRPVIDDAGPRERRPVLGRRSHRPGSDLDRRRSRDDGGRAVLVALARRRGAGCPGTARL
jgi:hypothetical protein